MIYLTLSFPIFPFYPPEIIRKPRFSDVFRGFRREYWEEKNKTWGWLISNNFRVDRRGEDWTSQATVIILIIEDCRRLIYCKIVTWYTKLIKISCWNLFKSLTDFLNIRVYINIMKKCLEMFDKKSQQLPEACNFIKKETLAEVFSREFGGIIRTPFL